ncbi:MAG: NAD-dependent epimerase/dehydratase family protein [Stellaceae bacterium]|jgi:dTDP-L-rhamnose 4-epimerase
MSETVLITGGAGFIASHCAALLLREGYSVRALDNLDAQIHGAERRPPAYLDRRVELVVGDVRSPRLVRRALADVDAVIHLAARVGVGQSMYEVADYTDVNSRGTAVLLEAMVERAKRRRFSRLVVASSMSVYGEGLYRGADGTTVPVVQRMPRRLKSGLWEPTDTAGAALEPLPTPETKPVSMGSVYALSKYDQERLCLLVGGAYDIPAVALRFFNVYGPHQALSNPYSGVLAIFAARLLNGRPPLIFEDGEQRRDFVYVGDVAEACRLALSSDAATGHALNIGSGRAVTINQVARLLADALGVAIRPEVTGECRIGDIRHCFPDISQARSVLGYRPQTTLEEGVGKLVAWLDGRIAVDRVGEALSALASRGLTV